MPPLNPPRTNDGPQCRVCGCTQNNACAVETRRPHKPGFPGQPMGCSWIELPVMDEPRRLCSACAGSIDDGVEVVRRLGRLMNMKGFSRDVAKSIASAYLSRHEARKKIEAEKTG